MKRTSHRQHSFSELSDQVQNKNKFLDRKLEQEVNKYQKEIKTYCRETNEQQRVFRHYYDKIMPGVNEAIQNNIESSKAESNKRAKK